MSENFASLLALMLMNVFVALLETILKPDAKLCVYVACGDI